MALGHRDILLYRTRKSTLPPEELQAFPTETDLGAALGRRPDAVIVSNPTSMHLDVAIPAARAGCHILLEKPVSDNLERIDVLREAVERANVRVLMGFQFRFHPTLQQVHRMVADGSLGKVFSARAHWGEYFPDWHPWEDHRRSYAARRDLGGGALLTLCHPIDYLRWILGEVAGAEGALRRALNLEVEAIADIDLRFDSGASANVHLDYIQRPPEHTLEIVAERGRLRWDGLTGEVTIADGPEGLESGYRAPKGFERNDMFRAEMNHFVEVVEGKAAPVCSLDDGLRVQEIIDSVRRSAASSVGEIGAVR
ncbi:MAG TPA: Gfo/Idh/MocA family oxidoreductase [Anaerolineales bacterium]|nr:Gfo/Idh/MocA family oxidoreductase [Anaerolineales bacterium]